MTTRTAAVPTQVELTFVSASLLLHQFCPVNPKLWSRVLSYLSHRPSYLREPGTRQLRLHSPLLPKLANPISSSTLHFFHPDRSPLIFPRLSHFRLFASHSAPFLPSPETASTLPYLIYRLPSASCDCPSFNQQLTTARSRQQHKPLSVSSWSNQHTD